MILNSIVDSSPQARTMPFTLSEVVELASILRDVCIELVEFTYPENRTIERQSSVYNFSKQRPVSYTVEEDTRFWLHLFQVSLMSSFLICHFTLCIL